MQSFLGKINFVCKFKSNFAQIVRPLQGMIKKNAIFKWNPLEKEAFKKIKHAIAEAPALQSRDFSKIFILYTFTLDSSLAAVIMQKDSNNDERPISFMRTGLQGAELNYPKIEKQAYAVYKAVKHFRPYILTNHVIVFVPHPAVRSRFMQQELGERRGKWMACLQEYDLEFKLTHTVKGQRLCQMVAEAASSHGVEE